MYTTQENVRIVIALLKQYNIRHIVVSPGGTNIPISQAGHDECDMPVPNREVLKANWRSYSYVMYECTGNS